MVVPFRAGDVSSYYEAILPFYELETAARRDLAFWKRICRLLRPARALEVGSGLGRVTAVLARHCRWVAGIDVSLPMLARAHARLATLRSPLAAADMRALPFRGSFDLIAAPNDPLSHLTSTEDRRAALCEIAGALAPRGRFVLDGLHRGRRTPAVRRRRIALPGGALSILETWSPRPERARWVARFHYRLRRCGEEHERVACFEARAWDPESIVPFLDSCGLEVEELRGSFEGEVFAPDSPRLIVVAVRSR